MAQLDPGQLGNVLLALATSVVYAYVGHRLGRREVQGDARLAWTLFRHWWYGLAATTVMVPLTTLLRAVGVQDAALYVTLTYVTLLLLCYVLWALLYYLLYVFTGSRRLLAPVTAFYVAYYVFLVYLITDAQPYYDAAKGAVQYVTPLQGPALGVAIVLLVGPHILGGIGYFSLFFRTREPTQRYRIGLIAWSIIAWFSTALVGSIPVGDLRLSQLWWWAPFTRIVGLVAALAILMAYIPPQWVRERFGVTAVDEAPPAP